MVLANPLCTMRNLGQPPSVDVVALSQSGPYRMTLRHAHGVIVEYFPTTDAALLRVKALESLLDQAQGFARCDRELTAR